MIKPVWMVEDDSDDRLLTKETLLELGIEVPVRFFKGSDELYKALSSFEEPSLILIDYNSTPDNGLQILKRLKKDERFNKYPVIILSESNIGQYREECYQYGASGFVKKPDTWEGTNKKIALFFKYWLEVAEV